MALNCNVAFGRYLRALRERRPLSLDEVESLSRGFPDPINKGYLSRCENGRQFPALSKVVALSRIYEVPTDVLVERMELDMELDRLGGPDTEGKTFGELYSEGRSSLEHGSVWDSYALTRDASFVAHTDPVVASFTDRREQVLWACMNVATVAAKLGRFRYARHEFEYVDKTKGTSDKLTVIVPERLALVYRELRLYEKARRLSERAIQEAETRGLEEYLSFTFFNRARLAMAEANAGLAAEFFQKAFRIDRQLGRHRECAIDLHALARAYLNLGRQRAARRSAEAALRLARQESSRRTEAFGHILLGEIEAREKRPKAAVEHWRKAVAISKKLNDRLLRFKAELSLYRQALEKKQTAAARAIERRLKRLAPWIPEQTEEVHEFKRLSAGHGAPTRRKVAVSQPPLDSADNSLLLAPLPSERNSK